MVDKKSCRERATQVTFEDLFEVNKLTRRNFDEDTLGKLFAPYKKRFPKNHLKKNSREALWIKTSKRIARIFLEEMLNDVFNERVKFEFPNGATFSVENVAHWKLQKRESHIREFRPVFNIPYKLFMINKRPYFVKLYPKWKQIFNERKEEGLYV